VVRAEAATTAGRLALSQALLAARTCGVPVVISLTDGRPGPWLDEQADVIAVVETEAELIARLGSGGFERLRALVPIGRETRAAAHAAGVVVLGAPILATGRLELRGYLREQAVSRTVHRHGSVMQPAPEGRP
jgi:RHH-type proline utilization regulon transcriptional repressor/proline dehydrogenase/delta 1-pyrroline-5-carboxylate dehydrogenase